MSFSLRCQNLIAILYLEALRCQEEVNAGVEHFLWLRVAG